MDQKQEPDWRILLTATTIEVYDRHREEETALSIPRMQAAGMLLAHATHHSTIEAQAKTIEGMRAAFEKIISRSTNGDLGTSKVSDMRDIARSALALAQTEKASK